MRFSIERKTLLDCLKSMIRVVPTGCNLLELEGFLVECSEEDGYLYLTATNLESSILRKMKSEVETGGSFVICASLLLNIVTLLGGDHVTFDMRENSRVIIKSQRTVYTIPVLNANNYPKPEMPFPEDMLKITGLCDLYTRTSSSVSADKNKPSLTAIHLDIYSDAVRAVSCDGTRLAMLKYQSETGGKLSVNIPKTAFYHIACAVNNEDLLDVGVDGRFLVFMKEGLLFSTRTIDEAFLDTDALLGYHDAAYKAVVDVAELHRAINSIHALSGSEGGYQVLKMSFGTDHICFSFKGELSKTEIDVPAVVLNAIPDGFFYPVGKFYDCFKTIKGKTVLLVSSKGMLLAGDDVSQYMLMNVREPQVQKEEKEKKTKKAA